MRLVVLNRATDKSLALSGKVLKPSDLVTARRYSEIIDAAQARAAEIIEQARQEAERLRVGLEDKARERVRALLVAGKVAGATAQRSAIQNLEVPIAHLLTEALATVLRTQPREDMIRHALEAVRGALVRAQWVHVVVHPDAAAAAAEAIKVFAESAQLEGVISVVPHAAMEPDACIVESSLGAADAGIRTQLERLGPLLAEAARDLAKHHRVGAPDGA